MNTLPPPEHSHDAVGEPDPHDTADTADTAELPTLELSEAVGPEARSEARMRALEAGIEARDRTIDRLESEVAALRELNGASAGRARALESELASTREEIGRLEADLRLRRSRDLERPRAGSRPLVIEAAHLFEDGKNAAARAIRRMIIVPDVGQSRIQELTREEMTIGRAEGCDIRLESPVVSRLHARLFRRGGRIEIEDAGSTNGVLVNDQPVDRTALRHGDRISLAGRLELRYVEVEASARPGDRLVDESGARE